MKQKEFKIFFLVVLAVACAMGIANAQRQTIAVADIPFSFMVENTTFPAGKYTIAEYGFGELAISNEKMELGMFFLTEPFTSETIAPNSELIFDEYQGKNFLSKIMVKGDEDGYYLPKSRSERAMMAKGKPNMKKVKCFEK